MRNGSWRNSTHTTVFRCKQDTDGHVVVRPTLRCSGTNTTQRVIAKHGLHYGVPVRNRSWRNPANTTLFRCEQDTAGHGEAKLELRCFGTNMIQTVMAYYGTHYVVPVRTGYRRSWRSTAHTTVFRCEQNTAGRGETRPTLRCSGENRTQRVAAKHGPPYGVPARTGHSRSWGNITRLTPRCSSANRIGSTLARGDLGTATLWCSRYETGH